MSKEAIVQAVSELLVSAQSRGTTQGVLVYSGILRMLEGATSPSQIEQIKLKLNEALRGIEAHGDFTESEFAIVRKLRGWEGLD